MLPILNVLKIVSSIVFIGVLLYVYAYLPEPFELPDLGGGNGFFEISKEGIFYLFLGVFGLFMFAGYVVNRIGDGLSSEQNYFKQRVKTWTRFMNFALNVFLIILLTLVGLINGSDANPGRDYTMVLYIGIGLLIFALLSLMIVFRKENKITS